MTTKKFEDIREQIIESQLSQAYEKVLVDKILEGKQELLSANDIIEILGISHTEFQEMINLPNHILFASNARSLFDITNRLNPTSSKYELINEELKQNTRLPKPDLYILGKARWAKTTIKHWLEKQCIQNCKRKAD